MHLTFVPIALGLRTSDSLHHCFILCYIVRISRVNENMLPATLSSWEYSLVFHALSATLTCVGCALLFIILTQDLVHRSYRLSMALCATLLLAATYHNFELLSNWENAYIFSDGLYRSSGNPFSDTHRFIDWLCTLPLILAAFICLFQETKQLTSLLIRLSGSTFIMTSLRYTSEVCTQPDNQILNFVGANFFLFYILYVLCFELTPIIKRELNIILPYIQLTRACLILSWPLYTLIYLMKVSSSVHGSIIQIAYCFTDILARVVPVLLCFLIAYIRSQQPDHREGITPHE